MFRDRTEAGQALARELGKLLEADPNLSDPVVLALPRGGVPVGLEVARALHAPLDLVLVRKIGVPFQPELAAGAVVDGDQPHVFINREVVYEAGLTESDLDAVKRTELVEIERRREIYLKGRPRASIKNRTAIVVDDGIATGATVRVALQALRERNPNALILAVPVAPVDTIAALQRDVDQLICLETPDPFYAIGLYYADFGQVSDRDVIAALDQAETAAEAPDDRA